MNFRVLSAQVMPRGRVFAALTASAFGRCDRFCSGPGSCSRRTGSEGCTEGRSESCPKGSGSGCRPAGSGRCAPQQAPAEQQVQLIYQPWTKFCMKGQDANAKQVCFTGKDGRIESGQPVVAAVIIEPEGEPKKLLRVTLPLGMQLVHGTRIIVDQNAPLQSPYVICFANGCMSDYEVSADLLGQMKKGQNLSCRRSMPMVRR
jgi:invasion protein IalB